MVLGLGTTEILLIILVIIILIWGPTKLPELFKSMGKSMGEFKKGMKESDTELKEMDKKKKEEEPEEEKPVKKKASKK